MTSPRRTIVNLRPATAADIPFMMELDRACPPAPHWTERQYRRAVQPGTGDPERLVLVADAASSPKEASEGREPPPNVLGFMVALHLAPEWELENIVVAPAARRKGLGGRLLAALLAAAAETPTNSVFLEVRESNLAARKLYEKAGFAQTARRKAYYSDPREDAILYRLQVAPIG